MVDISALYVAVVSDDSAWFFFPEDHLIPQLFLICLHLSSWRRLADFLQPLSQLPNSFCRLHSELDAAPDEVLFARHLPFIKCSSPSVSPLCVFSDYIEMLYGVVIAALRQPYHDFLADPGCTLNHRPNRTLNHEPDHILNREPNYSDRLSSVPDGTEVHEAAISNRGCQGPLHKPIYQGHNNRPTGHASVIIVCEEWGRPK